MTIASKVKRVDEDVLAVLSQGTITGNTFVISGQLERKHYLEVNKILEYLSGKWDRKVKGHVFAADPTDLIDAVLLNGSIEDWSHLGFFPTPATLAKRLVEMADVREGMACLEPSAGTGAIVRALVAVVGMKQVDCVELDGNRARELEASFPTSAVFHGDFTTLTPAAYYDRVVMNPPFSRQQDIKHVLHAFDFLSPGGRLVAVMSDGARFREDARARAFREVVAQYGTLEALPDETFKESGTAVRTIVVTLDKLG